MKDLLTSHSNQSHLVGIPKGSNNLQTPTPSAAERPATECQLFNEDLRGGAAGGRGAEGGGDKRTANPSSSSSTSMQPPATAASAPCTTGIPHQNSKKSSVDWSRAGHGPGAQGGSVVHGPITPAASGRGKMSLLEEQQMQRHDELFISLKDELGLKGDSSPSSSTSSSSSLSSSGRKHSSHPSKSLPLPGKSHTEGFQRNTLDKRADTTRSVFC